VIFFITFDANFTPKPGISQPVDLILDFSFQTGQIFDKNDKVIGKTALSVI
jgi:hypothetical protein